jgi:hypothetical protein
MSTHVSTAMHGDTMRVTVKGTSDRKAARKLAQQAAGTAFIGATTGDGPFTFDVSAKALAARKVVGSVPPARTMREAAPADPLATVLASLDPAVAQVIRAALDAQGANAKGREAAASTFREDVIIPAANAKRAMREAATCKTCLDHGIVKAAGKHAGQPYTTGADRAANPAPCPAKGCKAGKAWSKAHAAA